VLLNEVCKVKNSSEASDKITALMLSEVGLEISNINSITTHIFLTPTQRRYKKSAEDKGYRVSVKP
jgi:hypothetical protein